MGHRKGTSDIGRLSVLNQLQLAWQRRDIIQYLVTSDLKATYRNKALGYLWTLLDPLIMMGIYVLLVVGVFGRGGPQYPALLFSSLLAWWWFAQSLSAGVDSISGKGKLLQSVYFPKIVLPISRVIVCFIKYLFGMLTLIPFLIAYHADWSLNILWLPLLVLVQFILTIGVVLLVSIIGVYFRDMQNIVKFIIRAMFFLSPALYSAYERVPKGLLGIYMLNPFAALFESYKNVLVRGVEPAGDYMFIATGTAILFLVAGLVVFNKYERELAAVV